MDNHTKEQRSKNMKAIKSKNTKIEKLFATEMWKSGLRYRKNNYDIFGKPDFTFRKKRIAVFCDSEFFHGKDWDSKKYSVKTNFNFWNNKISRNIVRDQEVNTFLKNAGWTVLRFWGRDIMLHTKECVETIRCCLR